MNELNLATGARQPVAVLRIEPAGAGWWVQIMSDGTVEYSDGYEPGEAARFFWEAMGLHLPQRRLTCGEAHPGADVYHPDGH